MPNPSIEPDKFTIDEMMERLKARDSSDKDPELVTRPDGSQALRTKKRKRRTNQAANKEIKKNKRLQIAQIAGVVVLLTLFGLTAGIAILYANSSGFRNSLISKLERSSGAKVSMEQFRMNPLGANASVTKLVWPAGNALGTLDLYALSAKISPWSFTGKSLASSHSNYPTLKVLCGMLQTPRASFLLRFPATWCRRSTFFSVLSGHLLRPRHLSFQAIYLARQRSDLEVELCNVLTGHRCC
jgi:hypothetical protein